MIHLIFNINFIITEQSEETLKVGYEEVRKRFPDDSNGLVRAKIFDEIYLTNGVPNKNLRN